MPDLKDGDAPRLRERHRRTTRTRLIDVAVSLFIANGYDETTVEEIAAEANVSPRTFFRYFGTKEGAILSKFDDTGDQLAAALRTRPSEEGIWLSLRRMLDQFVDYTEDEEAMQRSNAINAVISGSESLRAGYLERMERMQTLATSALQEREQLDMLAARALVAAAFSCLAVAGAASADGSVTFGDALDHAMQAVEQHSRT